MLLKKGHLAASFLLTLFSGIESVKAENIVSNF